MLNMNENKKYYMPCCLDQYACLGDCSQNILAVVFIRLLWGLSSYSVTFSEF